jgi:hypothetical protein
MTNRSVTKSNTSAEALEELFQALDDRTRLRLLNLMADGEVCVCFFVEVQRSNRSTHRRSNAWRWPSMQAFADENNITANNAAVRVFRAREALRKQVRASCGTCAEHGCIECSCGSPLRTS